MRVANQRIAELEKALDKARRELERANRNWEKRFRILRASMHEIKNESFVRRRLEHQPMALHTAKMNYRDRSDIFSHLTMSHRILHSVSESYSMTHTHKKSKEYRTFLQKSFSNGS